MTCRHEILYRQINFRQDCCYHYLVDFLGTVFEYHKPAGQPSILEILGMLGRTITYFLMFLGNVLPLDLNRHALLLGVVLVLFLTYSLCKHRKTPFFILLIGFVLLIDFTATLMRSGFGVEQATSSRYSMFPLLLWAGLYAFLISTKFSSVRLKQFVILGATLGAILF